MKPTKPIVINPNLLKTRELLIVKVISGITKAGVHVDRRKEAARRACRGRGLRGEDLE
jgi:hypothetical protein